MEDHMVHLQMLKKYTIFYRCYIQNTSFATEFFTDTKIFCVCTSTNTDFSGSIMKPKDLSNLILS